MKKILLFTLTVLLLSSAFVSCKKDKAETVTQKLQHNWNIESGVTNLHDASGDDIETYTGTSVDFINFNSNGTFTSHIDGDDESATYSVLSDTEVSLSGLTYTIKTLTDKVLVLYNKTSYSSTGYYEVTVNAKR